jgi:transcriptional regulator with XRE-family HTH domain
VEQRRKPINPTRLVGERVAKIRMSKGLSQTALAEAMRALGIGWERIVVAKLEIGGRSFVKLDELLALCLVLDISLVDLLVPTHLSDENYQVTPKVDATAENVREWLRGEELLFATKKVPGTPFVTPAGVADIAAFVSWMPKDRAKRVIDRYFEDEENQ